ncbi:DUF4381 family protein [uncultured Dechloromonas sp.]|uniref:DUF4381 family protein n=1 Tax=uncultured Dechloromonas sp. TaxID=171719 RepID=UPI0025F2307B|nr:DUF4381 family protein [uncultured Dechloromonas sp.]
MNAPLSAAEQARLAALADIVEPAAIGWWPPAPGWLLVALLALLLAVRGMQQFRRHWQRNRYRRLALRRLRPLESAGAALPAQQLLSEALLVLRDCALAMPAAASRPADRAAWSAFLQARLPARYPFLPEALLHDAAYWPPARVAREDALAVLRFVRSWVEHHAPPA